MKLIETQEIRCIHTGILFSYADRYILESEEDLKDYPSNKIGDSIEVRRQAPFEAHKYD